MKTDASFLTISSIHVPTRIYSCSRANTDDQNIYLMKLDTTML